MRAYADTSFLVKLLAREPGSDAAVAEYRRRGRPRLFHLSLHALEVENAARQKAFHLRRSLPAGERGQIARNLAATLSRTERMLERNLLVEVQSDWETAVRRARSLSQAHTGNLGARGLDLLHIAFALELESELFFTTDACQCCVARAEGLRVVVVDEAD